ncbi:MAG: hypothetical protein AAGA68_24560 [Pseudomonadota bacterium]
MHNQGKVAALLLSLVTLVSPRVYSATLAITTSSCDTSAVGAVSPSGIAHDEALDAFVLIDAAQSTAYRVDRQCVESASFDLTALGATGAQGVAVNSADGTYAFVTPVGALVFSTAAGLGLGSCDLLASQVRSPTGLDYDPVREAYVILNDDDDEIVFISSDVTDGGACPVLARGRVQGLEDYPRIGLALLPGGRIALLEQIIERVVLLDQTLTVVDSFRTAWEVGGRAPLAITYVDATQRLHVLDESSNRLLEVDIRGQAELRCDLFALHPSLDPQAGLALDPSRSQLLLPHNALTEIWALDAATCALIEILTPIAAGFSRLSAIAYDAAGDRIALADADLDELVILDRQTLAPLVRCQLSSRRTNTIVPIAPQGWFGVGDENGDFVVFDEQCRIVERNAVSFFNIRDPDAMALGPLGELLYFSSSRGGVTTLEGSVEPFTFDTPANPSVPSAAGAVPIPGQRGTYLITARSLADQIVFDLRQLTIPLLAEPRSVAGTFSNGAQTLTLIVRPDNTLIGLLTFGDQSTSVVGIVNPEAGTIGLSFRPIGGGNALSVSGTVAADLESLTLSAPLGTMAREP